MAHIGNLGYLYSSEMKFAILLLVAVLISVAQCRVAGDYKLYEKRNFLEGSPVNALDTSNKNADVDDFSQAAEATHSIKEKREIPTLKCPQEEFKGHKNKEDKSKHEQDDHKNKEQEHPKGKEEEKKKLNQEEHVKDGQEIPSKEKECKSEEEVKKQMKTEEADKWKAEKQKVLQKREIGKLVGEHDKHEEHKHSKEGEHEHESAAYARHLPQSQHHGHHGQKAVLKFHHYHGHHKHHDRPIHYKGVSNNKNNDETFENQWAQNEEQQHHSAHVGGTHESSSVKHSQSENKVTQSSSTHTSHSHESKTAVSESKSSHQESKSVGQKSSQRQSQAQAQEQQQSQSESQQKDSVSAVLDYSTSGNACYYCHHGDKHVRPHLRSEIKDLVNHGHGISAEVGSRYRV
ncbi:histidine-rich glycoprotein-like [Hylaeus anthracinus]|uniref:histidine-rich glycoprotein-like n=1 Tax=Hylaeus anthracinus TaxID=313031 RepID=UPI0023B92137|nr:histidine-rich glycoprotein-like [Hylaeus anthracinus]